MGQKNIPVLELETLDSGIPAIPQGESTYYKHKCMVCLDGNGHASGVKMTVNNDGTDCNFIIRWDGEVDDQLKMAHADNCRAAEDGACAITFLMIRELTPYTTLEQARRGTTVDYYLTDGSRDDNLIFNRSARLEVSGIYCESKTNTIDRRIKQKLDRLLEDDSSTYIVIVEFGRPQVKMVKKT